MQRVKKELSAPLQLTAQARRKLLNAVEIIFGAVEAQNGALADGDEDPVVCLEVDEENVYYHWHELFYGKVVPAVVQQYNNGATERYINVLETIYMSKDPISMVMLLLGDLNFSSTHEKPETKKKLKSVVL